MPAAECRFLDETLTRALRYPWSTFYTAGSAPRGSRSSNWLVSEFVLLGQALFTGQVVVGRDAVGWAYQGVGAGALSDRAVLVWVRGYRNSRRTRPGQYADRRGDGHRDSE